MGKCSIIDYLVISEDMAALYASDFLWISAPTTPHHPFISTFRADHREALYLRRIAPKVFPIHPPIGCEKRTAHLHLVMATWHPAA